MPILIVLATLAWLWAFARSARAQEDAPLEDDAEMSEFFDEQAEGDVGKKGTGPEAIATPKPGAHTVKRQAVMPYLPKQAKPKPTFKGTRVGDACLCQCLMKPMQAAGAATTTGPIPHDVVLEALIRSSNDPQVSTR